MDGYKDLRLQIPDELLKYIKKLSIDQEMSLSKVVENIIREHASNMQQASATLNSPSQSLPKTPPTPEPASQQNPSEVPTPTAPGED